MNHACFPANVGVERAASIRRSKVARKALMAVFNVVACILFFCCHAGMRES